MGDVAQIVNLDEGWADIKTHGLDALAVSACFVEKVVTKIELTS